MVTKHNQVRKQRAGRKTRGSVTMREIAEEVGVSTATVSRAINTPDQVKKKTRDKIKKIIHDRHYVSDALAVSLASQRSQTIGVLIPTIVNSIYAAFTQAIQQACQKAGYTLLIGITEYSQSTEFDLVTRLLERRIDGLILTGVTRDPVVYDRVSRLGVPFITTWRSSRYKNIPSFSFSNYDAATTAMEHLIQLGHRSIGLICGKTDRNDRALERARAYADTLERHGLGVDRALVRECDFEFTEGQLAMEKILRLEPAVTAVFCANDIQAVGAIHACRDLGYGVPGDISIIGFDDHPITEHIAPQLTTIRVPAHEMGELATKSLISAIARQELPHSAKLDTQLVVRGSTRTVDTTRFV
jgi:LacI family transcriptional regulator